MQSMAPGIIWLGGQLRNEYNDFVRTPLPPNPTHLNAFCSNISSMIKVGAGVTVLVGTYVLNSSIKSDRYVREHPSSGASNINNTIDRSFDASVGYQGLIMIGVGMGAAAVAMAIKATNSCSGCGNPNQDADPPANAAVTHV
jgi:hypothetical protein